AYLFTNGQQPFANEPGVTAMSVTTDDAARIAGSITLGHATARGDRLVIPVIVTRDAGSAIPRAMSLNLHFDGADASDAVIRRAGATKNVQPAFETVRHPDNGLSYIVAFDANSKLAIDGPTVVAEIEIARGSAMRVEIDPALTMLSDYNGMHNATVASGALHVSGTGVGERAKSERKQQ